MNMRYRTRLLWLFGIGLMLLLACGCGGGDGSGNSDDNNPSEPFTVEYHGLQYRSYENPADNRTRGFVGLQYQGGAIQDSDVSNYSIMDSGSVAVTISDGGVYLKNSITYDCYSGSCTQTGPNDNCGVWFAVGSLPADTYTVDIEMVNGQTLSTDIDYPGEVTLPVVTGASMSAVWDSGALDLSWTNPTGGTNWDQVDHIRIEIFDGSGATVLIVRLNTPAESVTIPASLVGDAESLGDGTLAQWRIQTRAYDTNSMNYARGYSNIPTIPIP